MAEQNKQSDLSLEQVLLRRGKKIEYETIPTSLEGVLLRVEKDGERPRFTAATLEILSILGESFTARKTQIKQLEKQQKKPRDRFKNLPYKRHGFRGIESVEDKFSIAVDPTYTIAWDFDKLRKFLGPLYEPLVTESLDMNIIIPLGRETDNGPLDAEMLMEAIIDTFLKLRIKPEELDSLVTFKQTAEVDEEKFAELVADRRLKVTRNLGTVALSFAVEANPLEQ